MVGAEALREARAQVDATRVDDEVARYVIAVVRRTRELPSVQLGASPRAAVHLLGGRASGGPARGRDYVTPDDVGGWRPPCSRHRLVLARRPSSSATAAPTPCDRARRRCRCRDEPLAARARAVLAAIAVLTALTSPVGGALAALALAGAIGGRRARGAARPEVRRTVPRHLARGVRRRCASSRAGAGPVRLRQPAPADLDIAPREADGRLEATVTPLRRGRHVLGPVALRSEGPLGLGRWRHEGGGEEEVTVYPDVPAARRLALAVRQGRFRESGRLTRGPLGLGTEFESIRDYEPDDDIRQVNWRATERMQRPMSNQYRVEQDREVMLLLDAGRLMASPLGDRTRLDVAVDAAVAVALVADVLGDRAGVARLRPPGPPPPRAAAGRRRAVVRALLDLEPRADEPDYELAFRSVEGAKRSLVLIFCDLLEETAARPLVDAVPVLARRHAVTSPPSAIPTSTRC